MKKKLETPTAETVRQRATIMFLIWALFIGFYIYDLYEHVLEPKTNKVFLAVVIGIGVALIYSYRIIQAQNKQKRKNL